MEMEENRIELGRGGIFASSICAPMTSDNFSGRQSEQRNFLSLFSRMSERRTSQFSCTKEPFIKENEMRDCGIGK